MAIMMITHDLGVIAEVSDEVAVMYAGEVVERAPIEVLFNAARHPYTIGLMRSLPKLGAKFKTGKQPFDHATILSRVAVLEAMEKSVRTGKVTRVAQV